MRLKLKILYSCLVSVGMLIFSYWVSNVNFPLPISGEGTLITGFELIHSYFFPPENKREDVLAINVSHNKQLVYNEDSTKTNAITDRWKLLDLLNHLKNHPHYRYIMLDVFFSEHDKTDADSALYNLIAGMDRIVILKDPNDSLPNQSLYEKSGGAGYHATPTEQNFVKYPYKGSMPLRMYENLTQNRIDNFGPIYHEGFHLVRSNVILNFDYIPQDNYYELGDCMTKMENTHIPMIDIWDTKDKYIIIGAFEDEDIHSTYLGKMAGPAINFNAFLALKNKHHHVSIGLGVILFCVFFFFSYTILSQREINYSLTTLKLSSKKKVRIFQRLILLICSWLGFTVILSLFCILTYKGMNEIYDILATSTLFGILNVIVKLYNIITDEKLS